MGGHLRLFTSSLCRFFKGRSVSSKLPPQFLIGDTVAERFPVAGTLPQTGGGILLIAVHHFGSWRPQTDGFRERRPTSAARDLETWDSPPKLQPRWNLGACAISKIYNGY